MAPRVTLLCLFVALLLEMTGCRGEERDRADSAQGSLPPVYPAGPAKTNWNTDAGPVMIASVGNNGDSAAVILPEATDSTIASFQGINPPVAGLSFDLFGKEGKVASSDTLSASSPRPIDAKRQCYSWPLAKLQSSHPGWRVGFVSGHVHAIELDSIEAMSSTDSAVLAASLAQTAAILPAAADPTFRGLPFRVRSAFRFQLDSVDVVIADVVRSVNEEANPRLEHLLIVGERPAGTAGKYTVGYYNRTAGPEESIQATELLTAVRIGATQRPAFVVNIEYDDGAKFGLIERTGPGQWRATWRSAYTDC